MKIILIKIIVAHILGICYSGKLIGQHIMIKDTICYNLKSELHNDSSFIVEGEVVGLDKGSIKITSGDKIILAHVPIKQGKFFFSGTAKSLDIVHFAIEGDYYDNVFYLEPGRINIKYIYQQKFTARGTRENDLSNYFADILNRKNSEQFYELNANINLALKEKDLTLYLKLIDSLAMVEQNFFQTLNEAIDQRRVGFYLLPYINYYYINYGYFSERNAVFSRLPENIKQSSLGKAALAFLERSQLKSAVDANKPSYWFTLKTAKGDIIELSEFKGKTIVLDFWASWCLPCIAALPLLKEIHENDVSTNVVYISVSIDKKEEEWKRKEKELKLPWFSLLADESTIEEYGVNAVPCYIIINKGGIIAGKGSSLSDLYSTLKVLSE